MKVSQVAAQLYTLRDHARTPGQIVETLKKVRQIGYEAVQLSGLGPVPDNELAKMLDGEGLVCCATHESGDWILDRPQWVVDKLNAFGCKYCAYPYPGVKLESLQDVKDLAARLDAAGKVFAQGGKWLLYHNHHIEFRRFEGQLMLEVLYANTDPKHLGGEIDTYWVQAGGGNPVAWCAKLKGRLPCLHMKDYGMAANNTPAFAEIGNGNLEWKAIIATSEASGCEWFIVEQDTCPGDPFESLKMSFEFIRDNLCS